MRISRTFVKARWWFWFPRLGWNGGVPWKQEVVDIYINWLRYSVGLIIWPTSKENPLDKQTTNINREL